MDMCRHGFCLASCSSTTAAPERLLDKTEPQALKEDLLQTSTAREQSRQLCVDNIL